MTSASGERPDAGDDWQINVTHFIPSVELKGTRADKLEKLDLLLDHLQNLRRSIVERQPPPPDWRAGPPLQLTRADHWWTAGLMAAAAAVLVSLGVRACIAEHQAVLPRSSLGPIAGP